MSTHTTAQVRDLAYEFARLLRAELGDEIETVIARNQTPEYAGEVCASHDFLDANEIMAEAFRNVTGSEVDVQSEAQSDLWSAVWAIAKRGEFETDCVTDDERSNGRKTTSRVPDAMKSQFHSCAANFTPTDRIQFLAKLNQQTGACLKSRTLT